MIAKMSKYYFVVLASQREDFLARLQELGLVDVTTTGWEPQEEDRRLMSLIEKQREAAAALDNLKQKEGFVAGKPFASGAEAYDKYAAAQSEVNALNAEIARLLKQADEVRPWGEFDPQALDNLAKEGVELRFFSAYTNELAKHRDEWEEKYVIHEVAEQNGTTFFVVVSRPGDEVLLDAQELKAPRMTAAQATQKAEELEKEVRGWDGVFADAAASRDLIAAEADRLTEQLQFRQVAESGQSEAEGSLVVMEAWAEADRSAEVDRMLEAYPGIVYMKEDPQPEDDTPIKLKNNRFARLFEFIGDFYALPKYGTMDLTPYFAPFYMLFFGFCLADAGYGLVLALGGLFLLLKGPEGVVKTVGKLTILCGVATILFGFAVGSFFGIQLANIPAFVRFKDSFLDANNLFTFALAIGVVQILFAMVLKVIMTTRLYGFRYTLSTIGWILVILSGIGAMYLPDLGAEWFAVGTPAFYAVFGVGAFLMLFLNTPGKNPFINLGTGLWDTYNNVTGLLGDVLSYIRLFAIGLSGGILAQVFNSLALGLSPDIPVLREICIVLILLIGHGINLFMSTLSSFVHPMRLTFVEFYKNAGFEASMRPFKPFKKIVKQ